MLLMDEVGLGRLLQNARKKAGLTQQDLCMKAGLSYSTLAKIERGAIKSPSIFTIQRIAGVLGTTLDQLLGTASAFVQNTPEEAKKVSKSGIRFIYFDINGCLVRFFHRAFIQLSHDSGVPAELIEKTFWHYNDAVCRGEMGMDEFNRILASQIHWDQLNWLDYYLNNIDPISEMHDLVRWAAENYHVGLLSNIMPGFVDAMIQRGLLPDIAYSAVVDSSEVGAIKPEEHMYELAQGLANVAPEEILFVDDSRVNLMAAEKRGWMVLWFDDFRPEDSAARIRSILEF